MPSVAFEARPCVMGGEICLESLRFGPFILEPANGDENSD